MSEIFFCETLASIDRFYPPQEWKNGSCKSIGKKTVVGPDKKLYVISLKKIRDSRESHPSIIAKRIFATFIIFATLGIALFYKKICKWVSPHRTLHLAIPLILQKAPLKERVVPVDIKQIHPISPMVWENFSREICEKKAYSQDELRIINDKARGLVEYLIRSDDIEILVCLKKIRDDLKPPQSEDCFKNKLYSLALKTELAFREIKTWQEVPKFYESSKQTGQEKSAPYLRLFGDRLAVRYETEIDKTQCHLIFLKKIGSGMFNDVHSVYSMEKMKEIVFRKFKRLPFDEGFKVFFEDLLKEIKIHRQLVPSPYVVNLFDSIFNLEPIFIQGSLMELCQSSLYTCYQKFNEQKSIVIIKKLVEALLYMNEKGFFHGDVKLENVLVNERKGAIEIKLCDLGSTHPFKECNPFDGSLVSRSLESYLVPSDCKQHGLMVDIWGVGIIAHNLTVKHTNDEGKLSEERNSKIFQSIFGLHRQKIDYDNKYQSISLIHNHKFITSTWLVIQKLMKEATEELTSQQVLNFKIKNMLDKVYNPIFDEVRQLYQQNNAFHRLILKLLAEKVSDRLTTVQALEYINREILKIDPHDGKTVSRAQ